MPVRVRRNAHGTHCSMVGTLSKQIPNIISHVQLFYGMAVVGRQPVCLNVENTFHASLTINRKKHDN